MAKEKVDFTLSAKDKTGRAFNAVGRKLHDLGGATNRLKSGLRGVAPLMAAAFAGASLKGAADAADNIHKLNQRLGIATEILSQYQHVAALTGVEFTGLARGMQKLGKSISDATKGLSTPARALDDLGLSAHKLKRLSIDDQFELIAEALKSIQDPSDRVRIAMDLMGRSGADLLSTMDEGAAGIRKMRAEADHLGMTLTKVEAESIATMNDGFSRLGAAVRGVTNDMLVILSPAITKITAQITDLVNWLGKASTWLTQFVKGKWVEVARALGIIDDEILSIYKTLDDATANTLKRVSAGMDGATGAANRHAISLKDVSLAYGQLNKKTTAAKKKQAGVNKLQLEAQRIFEDTRSPFERYNAQLEKLNRLLSAGFLKQDTFNRAVKQAKRELEDTLNVVEKETEDTAGAMKDVFADSIRDIVHNFRDLESAAGSILNRIGGRLLDSGLGVLSDAVGGFISSSVGDLFDSKGGSPPKVEPRAAGGPVSSGRPYLVGEQGPELFIPSRSGHIAPNGAGGGITYNIDARGAAPGVEQSILAALRQLDHSIEKRAVQAVVGERRRNPAVFG